MVRARHRDEPMRHCPAMYVWTCDRCGREYWHVEPVWPDRSVGQVCVWPTADAEDPITTRPCGGTVLGPVADHESA